jgi:hypothetical protein
MTDIEARKHKPGCICVQCEDIEARARAYAEEYRRSISLGKDRAYGEKTDPFPRRTACLEGYLAGARAEVELYKKRILAALDRLPMEVGPGNTIQAYLKKIIEGEK